MVRLDRGALGLSLLLLGCGAPGPSAEKTEHESAATRDPGPAGEEPRSGPASAGDGADAGDAGEDGDGDGPTVVEVVASEFHLAAHRDGELGLYPMSNDVMVVAGAQAFAEAAAGEPLVHRPGMTRGFLDPGELFLTDWHTGTIGGRWPESTWLSAYLAGQRWDSPYYVYYRKGERWQRKANVDGLLQWYYAGFARWTDDQTLALRVQAIDPRAVAQYGSSGEMPPAAQKKHAAALARATPRFDVLDAKPGAAAPPSFPAKVTARAMTARTSGEIDAVVLDEHGTLMLLRWPAGEREAHTWPLPHVHNKVPEDQATLHMVAHPDGGLWIGAALAEGSYLVRFDGEVWHLRGLATKEPLRSLSAGEDGALWAVTSPERGGYDGEAADQGQLWRSMDGEKWGKVALPTVQFPDLGVKRWEYTTADMNYVPLYGDPEDAQRRYRVAPKQVWAGDGEVWVAGVTAAAQRLGAELYTREVVLRTRATERSLELPSDNELRLELLDERPAKEFRFGEGEYCPGGALVTTFMSLPADAPRSGPIEEVEKLLREHPELALDVSAIWEARHRERRVVAFVADGIRKPRAAAVLGLLAAAVPEKRSFACRLPRMVRPLHDEAELRAMAAAYQAP